MAFPTKDTFTFDFEAQTDYPNWTPAQTKEYMNARGEELRVALNAVANLLNATTSDVSGADNTGIPETIAGSGTNVRDRVDWLYAQIVAAVLGAIPDGSLATIKYANGSVTAAKCAADVATQAELDDLAGDGRTTETVKGNTSAISTHLADYAHHYKKDAGGTDDYVVALSPAITSYVEGMTLDIFCKTANTGAATLNAGGGAKDLRKYYNDSLETGDIEAGAIITVKWDSANDWWQVTSGIKVTVVDASDTVKGIIEIATDAEYAAGTSTTIAVTPANVASTKTWEKIAETTLGSDVAQVDFTSIANTYKLLKVIFNATSTSTTSYRDLRLKFNDNATNYNGTSMTGNGSTVASATESTTSIKIIDALPISDAASAPSVGEILIQNKQISKRGVSYLVAGLNINIGNGGWYKTPTEYITKISLIASSDSIKTGSQFVLWGVK